MTELALGGLEGERPGKSWRRMENKTKIRRNWRLLTENVVREM